MNALARRETIERAALRFPDGTVLSRPRPARHHDLIRIAAKWSVFSLSFQQGFRTSRGRFTDRRGAAIIAIVARQRFVRPLQGPELFTENLW